MYGVFGREITKLTVIYGVHIRFWPTLHMIELQAEQSNGQSHSGADVHAPQTCWSHEY